MKTKPNEPCYCGSGKKFKKCHGAGLNSEQTSSPALLVQKAKDFLAEGRLKEAEQILQALLRQDPKYGEAWLCLGLLATQAGDSEAAKACFEEILSWDKSNYLAWFYLGNTCLKLSDFLSARQAYQNVLQLKPNLSEVWVNLGNVEKYLGQFKHAYTCYLRSVETETRVAWQSRRHSNLLISLHYDRTLSHEQLFDAHVAWAERHAQTFYPKTFKWPQILDPDRCLRIAYVSGSFNGQIVGHFLEKVLANHDPSKFELYAFSSTGVLDAKTQALRQSVQQWFDISTLSDDVAAEKIKEAKIDILIDLDGHSPTGRPLVLARKPAPIQVEWLDYFNTTGMAVMDYLITDPYTTPENSPQRFSERVWRLPDTRFCYTPPDYAPCPSDTSFGEAKSVTFGSFNRQDKLNTEVIELWARILHAVPSSRLFLKNRALGVETIKRALLEKFAAQGIAANRLILKGASAHAEMLQEYRQIDIALDTFPYNGGLTTCECLWMECLSLPWKVKE